jgi:DNA-directed RNA polymerase subunit RPC12/RpoP
VREAIVDIITRVTDSTAPTTTTATTVTCNHCGAPLAIADSTRFVNCTYCGARLEVHRKGNALYTEVLDAIDQRTKEIAADVGVIRRQNEIERLDREWAMRREELMVRGKNGSTSTPSIVGGVLVMLITTVFGGFWTVTAANAGAPGIFPLFGVFFILAGIAGGITMIVKAGQYDHEQRRYEAERARLLREQSES